MNQFLEGFAYDAPTGSLSLGDSRYIIAPPTLLMELQKNVEGHLPVEAPEIVSEAATAEGAAIAARYQELFSYSGPQIFTAMAFMLTQSGWGSVSVEMANMEGREAVLKVDGSPFAQFYGPSSKPVCYLLLGMIQGAGLTVFEQEVDGMEVQCAAKGDACCRFVVSGKAS